MRALLLGLIVLMSAAGENGLAQSIAEEVPDGTVQAAQEYATLQPTFGTPAASSSRVLPDSVRAQLAACPDQKCQFDILTAYAATAPESAE